MTQQENDLQHGADVGTADGQPSGGQDAGVFTKPDPTTVNEKIEQILDFDAFMNSARRAIRTVPLCARADLADAYDRGRQELANLVTPDGELLSDGEKSLADASRVQELDQLIRRLHTEMQAATFYVVLEAMSDDDWDAFQKQHRDRAGDVKNMDAYTDQLISRSATKPSLTAEQVKQLRGTISSGQVETLLKAATEVNRVEGLDVPKLPSYLPTPSSSGSSTS